MSLETVVPEECSDNNSTDKDSRIELSSLDEMFAASRSYRRSSEYLELLKFINKFPRYSPYNCLLLHTQNPSISYVATARAWRRKFNRHPKFDARPLIILAPMSPILFVYDLKDTEGGPVPDELGRPYQTQGALDIKAWVRTVDNIKVHCIEVREVVLSHEHAGSAMKLDTNFRRRHPELNIEAASVYLVLINSAYTLEDKYSSLAHELAHIFCGHVGAEESDWWEDRRREKHNEMEIEAESAAYLICQRKGLLANSNKYLAQYRTGGVEEMPLFSFNAVLNATAYIENLGKPSFKAKKARKHQIVPDNVF